MKEAFLFEQLKEYLTKEYIKKADEKNEIIQEKVQLEVEKRNEENPLFEKKETEKIKRMFSPFGDDFFNAINVKSQKSAELNEKIAKMENIVNDIDSFLGQLKEYINFVGSMEKKWMDDTIKNEIVEKKEEDFREYTGNSVADDAKAMIMAAVSFLESEYPDVMFYSNIVEENFITSSEANSNLIRIITYTISSTIESMDVDTVWVEIERVDNDMVVSLQLMNVEGLVGHYAYKTALTII